MSFNEIINSVRNAVKATLIARNVELPGGKEGYISLDATGNETIFVTNDPEYFTTFEMARTCDLIEFAKSIPSRYGKERAADFREIYVQVDDNDVPVHVWLNDKMDAIKGKVARASFRMRPHRDFERWMGATNLTQTQFRNLLIELVDQHDHPDLGHQLQILNYKIEINLDSAVETERDMVFSYQQKEAEGAFSIPKIINVNTPIIAGADLRANVVFEVVVIKPNNPTDKIKFSLVPFGKDRFHLLREAYGAVADLELIKPLQEAIKEFAEIIPPSYVRKAPETMLISQVADSLTRLNNCK